MGSKDSRDNHRLAFGVTLLAALLVGGCTQPVASTSPPVSTTSPSGSPGPTVAAVATPEPTPEPEPSERPCPTADPLTPMEFWDAPGRCFGSDDVTVLGWLDTPPVFGFTPPEIRPNWLAYPPEGTRFFTLFGAQPTDPEHVCPDCQGFLLHLPPGSNIVLQGPARWVLATGHRHDPAAERCHYVAPPDDGFGELPDDKSARETCRLHFILVTLEDAPLR